MEISLLCNAGLAICHNGSTLMVDAPNGDVAPFPMLKNDLWQRILHNERPYDNIVGFYFTHCHKDHYDEERVSEYLNSHPDTLVFLPEENNECGKVTMGNFEIEFSMMPHAPMPEETPPHVITRISVGGKKIYIAGDAMLDAPKHAAFIGTEPVDIAFWNSMYLSRPETRELLQTKAKSNYIYHMPEENPDDFGLWKKCRSNFRRYGDELGNVVVMDRYPYTIEL